MVTHDDQATRPVLVGVEQGDNQDAVVRYAARHASAHGRPLRLLHAAEKSPPTGAEQRSSPVERSVPAVLAPMAQLVESEFPDVVVTAEVAAGRPAATLVERSGEASWLVIGHRGSGGFARLPLGSVSWQVATHARCPVVVVRPTAGDVRGLPVVVGVDVRDVSGAALDLAYAEAALRGVDLRMVHGAFRASQMPAGPGMVAPDFAALDERARQVLAAEAAKRASRYPEVKVYLHVERVRPATVLAEASQRACLLVVGSHGRTGVRRLMLGSISGEALHTAACPVAVVPSISSENE